MPSATNGCCHLHRVYHVLSKYTQLGKNPASRIPSTVLNAASWPKFLTKPMPIMTAPHMRVIKARCNRGPILRIRTVEGGWKTTYVVKKTRLAMFWMIAYS